MSEVLRHNKYSKVIVLSLGTGTTETQQIFNAEMAATWNSFTWLFPLIIFLDRATTSMNEYYHGSLFRKPTINYLRIQVYVSFYLTAVIGFHLSVTKKTENNNSIKFILIYFQHFLKNYLLV